MDVGSGQRDSDDLMRYSLRAVGKPDETALPLRKAHLPREGNSLHCPGGADRSPEGLMAPAGSGFSDPYLPPSLEDHLPLSLCTLLKGLATVFANTGSLGSDLWHSVHSFQNPGISRGFS